uniref:Uncharacterized protein n=1 Tax=Manihot esculenta TaxID=3983 RepID=A0A2C9U0T1_MANES
MGKKRPQKTKELSVAIAEASSRGDETQRPQQPQTPRKRGRPRKIIEKTESEEKKEGGAQPSEELTIGNQSQTAKISQEEEKQQEIEEEKQQEIEEAEKRTDEKSGGVLAASQQLGLHTSKETERRPTAQNGFQLMTCNGTRLNGPMTDVDSLELTETDTACYLRAQWGACTGPTPADFRQDPSISVTGAPRKRSSGPLEAP